MSMTEPNESATTTTPDGKPWGDRTPESLWDEVKTLRDENAKRRQALAPYSETFDGIGDDTRAVLIDFAKAVKSGDEQAIKGYVAAWAESFGISKAEVADAVEQAEEEKGRPLTAADLQKLRDELKAEYQQEWQQAEQARQVADIAGRVTAHAEKLGYDQAKDPVAWTALLNYAMRLQQSEGLEALPALDKAHEALEGWRQQQIDTYVASKGQEARRRPAPSSTGSAPAKDSTPKNLKEANEAARARFNL